MRTLDEIRFDINQALSTNATDALSDLAQELRQHNTPQSTAAAENALGAAHTMVGDVATALEHYEKAISLYKGLGDNAHLANVTTNVGNVYMQTGDYGLAMEHFRRALDVHEELGNRKSAANTICNIGSILYLVGDYPGAVEYLQRASSMYEDLGERAGLALVVGNIGGVLLETGEYASALEHLQTALGIHDEVGDRFGAARTVANVGAAFQALGNHDKAMEYCQRAFAEQEALGDRTGVASTLGSMIELRLAEGSIDEATQLLDVQASHDIIEPQVLAKHWYNRAKVAEANNDLDATKRHMEHALAIVTEAGARSDMCMYHKALRDLSQQRNDFPGYIAHNNEYLRITEEIRGKDATQKMAMLEADKRIAAERAEKEKHRALLYNTLPPSIADRVLRGEVVNDAIDMAAIMFMDMVGFTTMSSGMDPSNVVTLLSSIFSACDAIMAEHGLMKIKTIGDSYMAATFAQPDAIAQAARAALQTLSTITRLHPEIVVRIGLHCGPVTAGVIGIERLQYDVWGDTVNVASRMESTGEPGRIHISEAFAEALRNAPYTTTCTITERGTIDVKGKGAMTTYWLDATA